MRTGIDGTSKPSLTHNPKNALWSIWDEVSASALGSGPRGERTSRRSRRPMVRSGTRCLRQSPRLSCSGSRDGGPFPLHAVVVVLSLRLTLGCPIDKLLSIRMPQAASAVNGERITSLTPFHRSTTLSPALISRGARRVGPLRALLEPDAVKAARPVLRGGGAVNAPPLPDPGAAMRRGYPTPFRSYLNRAGTVAIQPHHAAPT